MRTLALALALFGASARADRLTEDFKTATHRDPTSTAVWNLAENRAHLPYYAVTDSGAPSSNDVRIDIGDGSDGVFDSTTFTTFDSKATSTLVTLDTSKIYQFTTFTVPAGVTLTGSGSSPLRIRTQGNVEILGTINLNGAAGSAGGGSTSMNPAGGGSCCGGGAGGAGGSTNAGSDGISADQKGVGSGKAGSKGGNNGGGGGGAGYDTAGNAGQGGIGNPGAAGGSYTDVLLTKLQAGSGGGGGGAGSNSNGGGGGGGGGALRIDCGGTFHIRTGGSIVAKGGAGGAVTDGTSKGGAGGGGSGGAIALFAGGQLTNDGSILATGGAGGTINGSGGTGGAGQVGQVRIVNAQDNGWVFGTENPPPNMANFGQVQVDISGPTVILSKSYDIGNSAPTFTTSALSGTFGAGTTATLQWKGSSDNFVNDDTGFVASTNVDAMNGKRFVKFRITLSSTNRAVSPDVRSVTLDYTPRQQGTFSFTLAGCARVGPRGGNPIGLVGLLVYLVSLPILVGHRRARLRRRTTPPPD